LPINLFCQSLVLSLLLDMRPGTTRGMVAGWDCDELCLVGDGAEGR
jgi:hypothetical protein